MSKILVTGGCGFLGSHVCELFKSEGWDVVAFDNMTKFEYSRAFKNVERIRNYNLEFLESIGVPTIVEDIRNVKTLTKALQGCDFAAHCAAQPAMTVAIDDPMLDFETNVQGTLNLLEACTALDIPMVNCSTIHVYGNESNQYVVDRGTRFEMPEGPVYEDEELLTGTVSPLHASKRCAEIYLQAFIDTYSAQVANFRLTGIYGPRQFGGEDHGWVANFAIRTVLGQPVKVFGTDKQVRDILYVKDAAHAFLDWYLAGSPPGTYNVGGGKECTTSIRELLTMLRKLTSQNIEEEKLAKRHGDLWWFVSNCSQALEAFGWKPTVLPLDGVQALLSWIQNERSIFE